MGMGCCLAALISDFLSAAKHTSMATTTFLANIAKGEGDGAEEMALLTCLEGDKEDCVLANDNPGASIDASMRHNDGNVTDLTNKTTGAPPQQCCTPPAKEANQSAKKKRKCGNSA